MSSKAFNQFCEVSSFQKLVNTPFAGKMNAICWRRELKGDFEEIADKILPKDQITEISEKELRNLPLSSEGQKAREIILNDLNLLSDYRADPVLNLIQSYEKDEFFFPTDVYSFHVDQSPIATDTFLCTYFGKSSEIIPNEQVIQKIQIPELREKLRALYEGKEADFELFLEENYFDLHYQALAEVQPTRLGTGNLWRLATENPQSLVPPCVHRAPNENGGLRLLLIC